MTTPGDLYLFSFSIVIPASKELVSEINGSDVCISLCLTSLISIRVHAYIYT
jgi:hypothetical protein